MSPTGDASERQRRYQELREANERQLQRRREQSLERIDQLHRKGLLQSLVEPRRRAPLIESIEGPAIESIEGPAPGEDSSVPPDPPARA